jgi:hypothetical protein
VKNIVLIPCWKRDDFLSVTLDYIKTSDLCDKYIYIFLLDRDFSPHVENIANRFSLEKIIHKTPRHKFKGNTYNILEGYKISINLSKQHNSQLIYLIEEDIFIGKDFFSFHENIQSKYDSFCVSAVKNQNTNEELSNDPNIIYYGNKFQSLGISWKLHNLEKVINHANCNYYSNMQRYLYKTFPKSTYGGNWPEQDGLINRIMEQDKLQAIYPHVARAFHAGFIGYNRPGENLKGTLEERIHLLKTMNKDEMNNRAKLHKDINPCNLNGNGIVNFTLRNKL